MLKRLTVRGFKSIRKLEEFELRRLNVLIGANGAGKSNFVGLFRMLAELLEKRLQLFVQEQDGPDAILFGGRKRTGELEAEFYFDRNGYRISLRPAGDRLIFSREETWFKGDYVSSVQRSLGSGHAEARLPETPTDTIAQYVLPEISRWRVYHFHDTSITAAVRQKQSIRDNLVLKADASNLAPFLRRLRESHPDSYRRIIETIKLVAPFFGDFVHRDDPGERVDLEWFEEDDPDTPRGPRQLSDGSLRFICLTVLLLQPNRLKPGTILLDEPELGLHPYALNILGALLKEASETRQLIISTQSPELLSTVEPEDVIVVSHQQSGSTFERLEPSRLQDWLNDYALGELWKMNVLGGRPTT